MEKIAIYIPDEDAKKFILFQKHYDLFTLLLDKGIFDQKNCAVTLHFDSGGVLKTIQRNDYLYSRQHSS
jgi:hypothetical protein